MKSNEALTRQMSGSVHRAVRRSERKLDELGRENAQLSAELKVTKQDLAEYRRALHDAIDGIRTASKPSEHRMGGRLIRTAFLAGGAYVLGTRAGRQRYEQITSWLGSARRSIRSSMSSRRSGIATTPVAGIEPVRPVTG
jgi:hypothetical protein